VKIWITATDDSTHGKRLSVHFSEADADLVALDWVRAAWADCAVDMDEFGVCPDGWRLGYHALENIIPTTDFGTCEVQEFDISSHPAIAVAFDAFVTLEGLLDRDDVTLCDQVGEAIEDCTGEAMQALACGDQALLTRLRHEADV